MSKPAFDPTLLKFLRENGKKLEAQRLKFYHEVEQTALNKEERKTLYHYLDGVKWDIRQAMSREDQKVAYDKLIEYPVLVSFLVALKKA